VISCELVVSDGHGYLEPLTHTKSHEQIARNGASAFNFVGGLEVENREARNNTKTPASMI